MKKHIPRAGIAIAVIVALIAASATVSAAGYTMKKNADEDTLWKAEISDYDSSLSLLQVEAVTPAETTEGTETTEVEETEGTEFVDSEEETETITVTQEPQTLATSYESGGSGVGAPAALGSPEAGQFAFTTYGYGHCVGLSQNGANYYATYGGYSYQQILFHYYPGTTLVQESTSGTVTVNGVTGGLLEMVSKIVNAEMSPTMNPEALKAQAVATYSYIMANGGSISAVTRDNPSVEITNAVSAVLGQALYYNGSYALTLYTASSGGATASSADIYGDYVPYLVSVSSDYDSAYDPYYGEVKYLSTDSVRSRIQNAYGITLSDNPSNWIQLTYGDGGYVKSVCIDGQKTVNGYDFSCVLGLRSARFAYIRG